MSDVSQAIVKAFAADWGPFNPAGLTFWARDIARLAAVGFIAAMALLLAWHAFRRRQPGRGRIVLPALVGAIPSGRVGWLREAPALLFAAGLPFALLALADPHASLSASEVTYPGRRIALMIDASDSMRSDFTAPTLNAEGTQQAFFTTVAAATRFIELRRQGKYRDLMALIEFGNRSYVITPFTNDYDNLLLSISLIGDNAEFSKFPDPGTVIGSALEQSVEIFKAFNFLDVAGNAMVIFTDGEDTAAMVNGRSIEDILASVTASHIPLYFVRISYNKDFNEGIADKLWKEGVEAAGGRFYIARDESSLITAIEDIDRDAAGAVRFREYATQEPRFASFALVAALLWVSGAAMRLALPLCSTLP